MRTAHLAGVLVLDVGRRLERIGRAAHAALRRRGLSFRYSHGFCSTVKRPARPEAGACCKPRSLKVGCLYTRGEVLASGGGEKVGRAGGGQQGGTAQGNTGMPSSIPLLPWCPIPLLPQTPDITSSFRRPRLHRIGQSPHAGRRLGGVALGGVRQGD